jgi:hypothetical protein
LKLQNVKVAKFQNRGRRGIGGERGWWIRAC